MQPLPYAAALLVFSAACQSVEPVRDSPVQTLEAFLEAREVGDLQRARQFLAQDPRRWFGEREGEGSLWTLADGPWKGWDEHFRGSSQRMGPLHVDGNRISADHFEINDYFRLTERGGGWWRGTYFFDVDGRIEGFLISGTPGRSTPEGRGGEFRRWAFETHAEEAEYLMPGGSLDPTGDRPPRMRALLNTWRATVGLTPIE